MCFNVSNDLDGVMSDGKTDQPLTRKPSRMGYEKALKFLQGAASIGAGIVWSFFCWCKVSLLNVPHFWLVNY